MNVQPVTGITPKAMPIERGTGWLLDGFGYFSKSPMAWIGTIILLIIIGGAISFIPIIGALAPYLLMPVIMGGLMLGCQAQSQGGGFTVNHLFAGFSILINKAFQGVRCARSESLFGSVKVLLERQLLTLRVS